MRMFRFLFVVFCFLAGCASGPQNIIDLSGQWQFRMDPENVGQDQNWFQLNYDEVVQLPGTMAKSGKGYEITVDTKWTGSIVDRSYFTEQKYAQYRQPGNIKVPFWLQPEKHYIGASWYQREFTVPKKWDGKSCWLLLERPHWETTVWVDGNKVGTQNSLSTPHRYELGQIKPGKHRLTIRVDNSVKIQVGQNSHSISDHTQSNWNGIAGKIQICAKDAVVINDVQIFPQIKEKKTQVKLAITNSYQNEKECNILLEANLSGITAVPKKQISQKLKLGKNEITIECIMGENPVLWDEFEPNLYTLKVDIKGDDFADSKSVDFGMREFKTNGTYFTINGRKTFLRGTLECAIFPKTSHPAMDEAEWLRIFNVARNHGLNHMRFHSWCPPEAAFNAADKAGIYLHVECGSWANQGSTLGDGKPVDQFVWDEAERIVQEYGNHPSFCMMAYGNEPAGPNQRKYLSKFVNFWKEKDNRHVYTGAAAWPVLEENEYHLEPAARLQAWGAGLKSILNSKPPSTAFDFSGIVGKYDIPYVSHEIGQWCVYPNFKEIEKYTGVLKPKNFEIFKETLEENHLGHLAEDFLLASGKLQALCYKADIEAALRTPGMAGFQLLDLHDFPGQGTALVGVLDPFWEEKGYIAPKEFSQFCNITVPLARLEKRVFRSGENFTADIEVAHFGEQALENVTVKWEIFKSDKVVRSGSFPATEIPIGNCNSVGNIVFPLETKTAEKQTLIVTVGAFQNQWDFWVYPGKQKENAGEIIVAKSLDEKTKHHLENGGKVLLSLQRGIVRPEKGGNVAVGFSSIFWNTAWTNDQAPHTLGILCDPNHPALADFPTEYHSNWQWWEPIKNCQAMDLTEFEPGIEPIVRLVDDWFTNRSLGLIFEAKVGSGKIVVSSIDLTDDLENRLVSIQIRSSLLDYMNSKEFNPTKKLAVKQIHNLLNL